MVRCHRRACTRQTDEGAAGLAATGTIHAHQEKREIHPCNPGQIHRALAKENMHGTHPGKGACPAWMASPATGGLSNRRIPIIFLTLRR